MAYQNSSCFKRTALRSAAVFSASLALALACTAPAFAQDEEAIAAIEEAPAIVSAQEAPVPVEPEAPAIPVDEMDEPDNVTSLVPEEASPNTTIEDGDYIIQSALGDAVLDVAGASKANGANVQLYETNDTSAQEWHIALENDGYYSIKSLASGLYLDLNGAMARNAQNVWQYAGNGTLAQRWSFRASQGGYVIASAVDPTFVLDIAGASKANGTNAQVYQANDTLAQLFYLISLAVREPESNVVIDEGAYQIQIAGNEGYVLDVSGASTENSANVQVYESNETNAQRWYVTRDNQGFYILQNISSGKALDIHAAYRTAGTNVQQFESNGTLAQKWSIVRTANGTYQLVSALNGLTLSLAGTAASNSVNVCMGRENSGMLQQWLLTPCEIIQATSYKIFTALDPDNRAMDVPNWSSEEGVQMNIWNSNGATAQKFRFVSLGNNQYSIQSLANLLFLTNQNGRVTQNIKDSLDDQIWAVSFSPNGFLRLTSLTDGTCMTAQPNKVTVAAAANLLSQLWHLSATAAVLSGTYLVENMGTGMLDIEDGSYFSGANAVTAYDNGTASQAFIFDASGEYVTIVNARSYKALDVDGAKAAAGTNVQQWHSNGTKAQLWEVVFGQGDVMMFRSALDPNLFLTLNGNNAIIGAYTGSSNQQWRLVPTKRSVTGDLDLDCILAETWDKIGPGDGSESLFRRANEYVATFHYIGGNLYPKGSWMDWSPWYAKEMVRNNGGNCYRYASLLCWLGRSIGYDCRVISGHIPLRDSMAAHGWVEVYLDGETYICDPESDYARPFLDWFMMTYENAHLEYLPLEEPYV